MTGYPNSQAHNNGVFCTGPKQYQASQYSSTEWKGIDEFPAPPNEELWTVNSFLRRESQLSLRVLLLVGSNPGVYGQHNLKPVGY